jgi:hypothetical protein
MSCTLSVSSNQRLGRSRSSSVTESTSPESTSSDSHSSSDPDTHTSLSPWLQTPNPTSLKASFGMDIDAASSLHMMDLDSEMSFEAVIHDPQALNPLRGGNYNIDDIILSQTSTSTKSDMLMLEEIIKDGAFEYVSSAIVGTYTDILVKPCHSHYPSFHLISHIFFSTSRLSYSLVYPSTPGITASIAAACGLCRPLLHSRIIPTPLT